MAPYALVQCNKSTESAAVSLSAVLHVLRYVTPVCKVNKRSRSHFDFDECVLNVTLDMSDCQSLTLTLRLSP